MRKLTDIQKIEIVEKYQTGNFTCAGLGRDYDVTGQSIASILRIRNIPIFNDHTQIQRKYSLDQSFFDCVDTEEKAYFLGLLYADGCNYTPNNLVYVSLQEEDKNILIRLNEIIKSNRPLGYLLKEKDNRKNSYCLYINNKRISENLTKLGCVKNKTMVLKFPTEDQVPIPLIRHFIRGYFDGDGCVGIYKPTRGLHVMKTKIVGTGDICANIQKILSQTLNIYGGIASPNSEPEKNTRQITTHTTISSYKFLSWIYHSTDLYIERKFWKFKSGIELIPSVKKEIADIELEQIFRTVKQDEAGFNQES